MGSSRYKRPNSRVRVLNISSVVSRQHWWNLLVFHYYKRDFCGQPKGFHLVELPAREEERRGEESKRERRVKIKGKVRERRWKFWREWEGKERNDGIKKSVKDSDIFVRGPFMRPVYENRLIFVYGLLKRPVCENRFFRAVFLSSLT